MSPRDGYLLDSHVLLWWWFDPDRLSTAVRELLELSGAFTDLPGLLQADQAELDRLVLLSADTQLSSFPCQTLW